MEARAKMQGSRHSRLLVVDQGRLVGILALSDMLQYLSLKQELDPSMAGASASASRSHDAGGAHYRHASR
ncbi:CBS domain-containing protein [Bradyrhizobium sp. 138]|nr:CBS domain-containing protein [Bradyrhizobium sp. 138]